MNKRIVLTLAMAVAIATTGGCVSMGPSYDPAIVEQLRPGMTKIEVIALLGRPTSTAALPDGAQQIMWVHSRATIIGRAHGRALMLKFDRDGKYAGLISQAETNVR